MNNFILASALFAAAVSPSAATAANYILNPIPAAEQSVRYDRGQATVTSDLSASLISVTPLAPELRNTMSFLITVSNKSGQSFNVAPRDIRIVTETGKEVRVYTYDELVGRVKRAAGWQTFAVALAGGLQTYANSQPTTVSTNGYATSYAGRYSVNTHYQSNTQIYNSPATQIANMETQRQTSASLSAIADNQARTTDSLDARILQTTTLDSNYSLSAQIIADTSSLSKKDMVGLTVYLAIGSDTHVMTFSTATTNITNRADRPVMPPPPPAMMPAPAPYPVTPVSVQPAQRQTIAQASEPMLVGGVTYTPYSPTK